MSNLGPFSMGIGDRFARQGRAQLEAFSRALRDGIAVTPVWNKSHREHTITGTRPADVRAEADAAVQALGWTRPYFVDADHIGLGNVDLFLESSDFFTLDVAHCIGRPAAEDDLRAFVARRGALARAWSLPGLGRSLTISAGEIDAAARKFLAGVQEAGRIYRRVAAAKPAGAFAVEVSMDETDVPQTPAELLIILAAIADEGIPAHTIAPKFSGRFNKGVDYAGDVAQFAREFEADLAVTRLAPEAFGLPPGLKLSVHSGSDKFSIYPCMNAALKASGAGLHLKTAGTTWLEELAGLAAAGAQGLALARDIYRGAFGRYDEMCGPYASVVDIRRERLPSPDMVARWSGTDFAAALRHEPSCAAFSTDFRQFMHVSYKVAAEMGARYLGALEAAEAAIAPEVTRNILERHLQPVFG